MSNVGSYLAQRLEQLGVTHLFAVPGDFTSDLLKIIDERGTIHRIGCCNELNAGYAADGYARARGIGVVSVTNGVGTLSLLNAVAGAYAEGIPVVVIAGTLSNAALLEAINAAKLFHHSFSTEDYNQEVYQKVTVAHERIANPLLAPGQIDAALVACISYRRPVLIEIMEDCYYMPCPEPAHELKPVPLFTPLADLQELADHNKYAKKIVTAVDEAAGRICKLLETSRRPVLWLGNEISIYGLQRRVHRLLKRTGLPYASSLMGKSQLAEDTPGFIGVFEGTFTSDYTRQFFKESDCIIGLGVWNTDLNMFGIAPGSQVAAFAGRDAVRIGADLFVPVSLANLLDCLLSLLKARGYQPRPTPAAPPVPALPGDTEPITYDRFFAVLQSFLTEDHRVVADIGLSANGGSAFLTIKRENGFFIQPLWASIGWSVPAGLGASLDRETRTVVIVGDGAFKLTCQEVATIVRYGCNTVVFVMNNGVYGVEQVLLDPAPFRRGAGAEFEAANVLQKWDYKSLMKGFSGGDETRAKSASVRTAGELKRVLEQVNETPRAAWLISIDLDARDYPAAWEPVVNPPVGRP